MRVIMPLPDDDFDTTEVAVPWRHLSENGHEVDFVTESGGATPACDPRLISGVLFGQLGAADSAIDDYRLLQTDSCFKQPKSWRETDFAMYDGLVLPGGHAPGMRQYLGSPGLQARVLDFWLTGRPVGAICHGVLVLARTRLGPGEASVIAERRTTCLTKQMERSAYLATFWRLGRYYRTYPAYVQDEVVAALHDPEHFVAGPRSLRRDTAEDTSAGFVVEDGNYVSARWPGDAHLFAQRFGAKLDASA